MRLFFTAPNIEVVGDAGNGEETLQLILREKPDAAVVDISMPGLDGFQLLERMRGSACTDTKVILLTMHNNPALASRAVKLGAATYILKDDTFKDLVYAIETVMDGKKFISGSISEKLLHSGQDSTDNRLLLLTAREREILCLIGSGRKNKDIARELCISVKTVDSHRTKIMEKLDLHSIAELVKFAFNAGLI